MFSQASVVLGRTSFENKRQAQKVTDRPDMVGEACRPRRVDPERFRFHRFTRLLIRSIEAIYGAVMAVPTHFSPQFVIY